MFQFKVSIHEIQNPTIYDFRFTFTELHLVELSREEIYLNGSREIQLTSSHLHFITDPINNQGGKIIYRVIRAPRYGQLHYKHRRLSVSPFYSSCSILGLFLFNLFTLATV